MRLGRLSIAIHNAITMSVPFFLSLAHLVNSSVAAKVFQLPLIEGRRKAPDLITAGNKASTPSDSSSLLRLVVCGITLTRCRACHLRTKSWAKRNRWAALISTTQCEMG